MWDVESEDQFEQRQENAVKTRTITTLSSRITNSLSTYLAERLVVFPSSKFNFERGD